MCERVVNNICETRRGGAFLKDLVRPAEWRPGAFNEMVDALANPVMNNGMDVIDVQCCERSSWIGENIFVFSDGGCGGGGGGGSEADTRWLLRLGLI